jgi:catechol 2,3-dioxygenase-like lactoylglutathione lyase family enzyme
MTSIESVTLDVADLTAANRFYTAAFGLGTQVHLRASEAPTTGFRGFTLSLTVSQPATVSGLIGAALDAGASEHDTGGRAPALGGRHRAGEILIAAPRFVARRRGTARPVDAALHALRRGAALPRVGVVAAASRSQAEKHAHAERDAQRGEPTSWHVGVLHLLLREPSAVPNKQEAVAA